MKSYPNLTGAQNSVLSTLCAIFLFTGLLSGHAQTVPAFPGAEGFGSTTSGGRGGAVLLVTNLNDAGPGSLRAACLTAGPRTIVFRVTGTIFLQSTIIIGDPYITIAGQTAPGGGIAVANEALRFKTHDVIIRGMRFRPGDNTGSSHPTDIDAVNLLGTESSSVYNIILDHCSLSWGMDKNFGSWGNSNNFGTDIHDVTVQWCISSEALHSPFHPKGPDHSMGMLFASVKNASSHHNLFVHNHARQPQFAALSQGEIINNVIYNYGDYATEIQSGSKVNVIKNYYKTGVDWAGFATGINVADPDPHLGPVSVYVLGNIGPGRPTDSGDEWNAVTGNSAYRVFSPPVSLSGVVTSSATDAYDLVLADAGAFPRDAVDLRIVSDVINGTGQGIASQDDVGGWPNLAAGTPPVDSDNDGMPNTWETANGLNPNDASDRNGDLNGNGYTNVEEYINGLVVGGEVSGDPPVVSNIPNQSISPAQKFAAISVDTYVSDPDNSDAEITWSWSGNSHVIVTWDGVGRKIKVKNPNGWWGSETITFTATDPDGNSDTDAATFTVSGQESPNEVIAGEEKGVAEPGTSGNTPLVTGLLGNYPNPFNPTTKIQYSLANGGWVTLKVFDVLGGEVATLVDEFRPAGYYSATWNGHTETGASAASGVYLYRMSTNDVVLTGRMLLAK